MLPFQAKGDKPASTNHSKLQGRKDAGNALVNK